MRLTSKTEQLIIDDLRRLGGGPKNINHLNALADMLQYGRDGIDESDSHRCRFCEKLQGGDSSHRCW